MKKGRKTAVRVLPSLEEAEKYIEGSDVANLSIEHSKGEYVKCKGYCSVAEFCSQYHLRGDKKWLKLKKRLKN